MEEVERGNANIIDVETKDVCVGKERRKPQKTLVQKVCYDYARNTTLHGLSYTTKDDATLIEKIFWILIFLSSICLCCYVIGEIWIKWKTRPVLVTVSERLVPVTEVPFPSVTICPQNKVKRSVYNYAATVNRLSKAFTTINPHLIDDFVTKYIKDFAQLEDLSQICDDFKVYEGLKIFSNFTKYEEEKLEHTSPAKSIKIVAPEKKDVIVKCLWRGGMLCDDFISEILTTEGLCFNINSLPAHEIMNEGIDISLSAKFNTVNWTTEHGYSYISPEAYPVPGIDMDEGPDLVMYFQEKENETDKLCNIMNSGYIKVFVQYPTDLPQTPKYYTIVRNGEAASMAISFNIINTSEELKSYSAEQRQCYFPNDRKLKYFKIYTESNCRMECLVNRTYDKHKCVRYYMPRENNTAFCTFTEILADVLGLRNNIYNVHKMTKDCNCLPSCYSVEYQTETLNTAYNLDKWVEQYNFSDFEGRKISSLQMFFKRPRFLAMRRSELFGVNDFLASIGGILGLFLGFSFLSLFEHTIYNYVFQLINNYSNQYFYYFDELLTIFIILLYTFRLCCIYQKDIKQEKIQKMSSLKSKKF